MATPTDSPSWRPAFACVARVLAFAIIPAWFAWLWLDLLAERAQAGREARDREQVREVLDRVAVMANPIRRFADLAGRLAALRLPTPLLQRRAAALVRREGGALELLLFDAAGRLLPLPGLPTPPRRLSEHFLAAVGDPAAPGQVRFAAAFTGSPRAAGQLAASPGNLVPLNASFRRGLGGWWRLTREAGGGHLLAFVDRRAIRANRLCDRAVAAAHRLLAPTTLLGWWDPAAPQRGPRPHAASWPVDLAPALRAAPAGELELSWHGQDLLLRQGEKGEVFFAVLPPAPPAPAAGESRLAVLAGATALALLLVAPGPLRAATAVGLRAKLVLLLLAGGGLQLALLTVAAGFDRQAREDLLLDEVKARQLRWLHKLDGDLPTALESRFRRYEEVLRRAGGPAGEPLPRVLAEVFPAGLGQRWGDTEVFCIASAARPLLHLQPRPGGDLVTGLSGRTLEQVAHRLFDEIRFQRGSERPQGDNPANLVSNSIGSSLFNNWSRNGQVMRQRLFDVSVICWADIVAGPATSPRALLLAIHDGRAIQAGYLRRWLRRLGRPGPDAPRLGALPLSLDPRLPPLPRASTAGEPLLRRLCDLVLMTRLPQHLVGPIRGRDHLVSALPGRNLDGYLVFVAQPLAPIRRQTLHLYVLVTFISLLLLAAGLTAATATARHLLTPLHQLTAGVTALQERRFAAHIAPRGVTEFRQLGERLNEILGDLRDLQVARTLQEQLWPEQPLAGPLVAVSGGCRTAADLGGDHHDWFALPSGEVVVAVGDVAGHGIAAALVTAAAKAELTHAVARGAGPAAVLAAMHAGFCEAAGRQRPMGFWLGMYQPASRLLRYAAAGHPFAALLAPGAAAPEFIGRPAYPLGARLRNPIAEDQRRLAPGSRLLLFTDGLVEALSPVGAPFGYDRIGERLAAGRALDGAALRDAMFAAVQSWSGRETPEDDVTLVVLDVPVAGEGGRC